MKLKELKTPVEKNDRGKADIEVKSAGLWAIRGYTRFYCGIFEDIPIPADYDGDSRVEPAIFHPSTGLWAIDHWQQMERTRFYFGTSGDIPVTR